MPDQYGNPTEAELRGQAPAGYAPPGNALSAPPTLIYSGNIGGRNVQTYGSGPQLTQEQATQQLANLGSNQFSARIGSMPVEYWQALNPGASAADLAAYKRLNQAYTAQTAGMGIGDKITNAAEFEIDRFGNLVKNVANNPGQLLTGGIDPIGTKIGNALTGSDNQALVGQFGGATASDFDRYEQRNGFGSLGAAREFSHSADNIAAIGGAAGAAHGIGEAFNSLVPASDVPTQVYRGGANLNYSGGPVGSVGAGGGGAIGEALPEIVVEGTRAGGLSAGQIAGIGAGVAGAGWLATQNPAASFSSAQTGGNAGQLNNSGGISGGAGTGGTTEGALGPASGAGNSLSGVSGTNTGGFGGNMGWDWGRILDTAGPIIGGLIEGQGAKRAGETAAAGSAAAIAESRRQYDTSRADQMPWLQAGQGALTRLHDPAANFQASPDYAFRRDEGTRDIGNSFSARGGAQSGNALRALTDFNSGLAGSEFGNWWNRQAGLANVGQTTATNLGTLGANSASNIGNALQNGANARASGVDGQTNALTGTVADLIAGYNRNRRQPSYGWGG